MDQRYRVAHPARGQLNRENDTRTLWHLHREGSSDRSRSYVLMAFIAESPPEKDQLFCIVKILMNSSYCHITAMCGEYVESFFLPDGV